MDIDMSCNMIEKLQSETQTCIEETNGYVYLVIPPELKGTNRVKIGRSKLNNDSRIKSYGKGTDIVIKYNCCSVDGLEKNIIKAFKNNFKLIKGNEYFEGNIEEMKKIFLQELNNNERDISKVHLSRDRPMTGLRADMIGLNLSPYDAFLKKVVENNGMMLYKVGFTQKYDLFNEEGIKAGILYKLFTTFWDMEGKRKERLPTATNFGRNIKRCDGVLSKRTSGFVKYTFIREEVEKYISLFDSVDVVVPDIERIDLKDL